MSFLGILGVPLGYVMKFIYNFIPNYGWAIIIFTVLVRMLSFPLQLKQQKSTARMSAYQPMIQEIQKKYANDKEKQNEEMMALQQEYGFSMSAGCAPMLINMLVLFGVIEVVYRPIQYILTIGSDLITQATEMLGIAAGYTAQSALLQQVQAMGLDTAISKFAGIFSSEQVTSIFNFNMNFMGIDLCAQPTLAFNNLLIFPILSVVTMALVNVITTKMSGQEMQGAMKFMPWVMSLIFVLYAFRVPVAFSLYYTVSNLLMFVQSLILKKIYDPEEYKAKVAAEIEEKRKAKKKKKTVQVQTETGAVQEKAMTDAELVRYRLEMARKLDAERYSDERTEPLPEGAAEELAESGKKNRRKKQQAEAAVEAAAEDSVAAAERALGEEPEEDK